MVARERKRMRERGRVVTDIIFFVFFFSRRNVKGLLS
jgi:hypothetical protein